MPTVRLPNVPGLETLAPPPGESTVQGIVTLVNRVAEVARAASAQPEPSQFTQLPTSYEQVQGETYTPQQPSLLARPANLIENTQGQMVEPSNLRELLRSQGKANASTGDVLKAAGLVGGGLALGLAGEAAAPAITAAPGAGLLGGLVKGAVVGKVGSSLIQQVPGEQSLPSLIKRPLETAPYFASGPGSLLMKGAGLATDTGVSLLGPKAGLSPLQTTLLGVGAQAAVGGLVGRKPTIAGVVKSADDNLSDWEYSLKKLTEAKAQGPEAFAAMKERLKNVAAVRQADKQAAQAANAKLRFSPKQPGKLAQTAEEMQQAAQTVRNESLLDNGLRAGIGPGNNRLEQAVSRAGTETAVQPTLAGFEDPRFNHSVADGSFGFLKDVINEAQGVAGAALTLKSSLSPPLLRQGLVRLITAPRAAMREFGVSMKAAASAKNADEIHQWFLDNPWISPQSSKGVQSPFKGFTFGEQGGKIRAFGAGVAQEAREADFQGINSSRVSRALETAPIVSNVVNSSERQAAVQLNLNAGGRYATVAQKMWAAGERDPRAYKALADVINHQNHYGSWSQGNIPVLFSTRALSGRVQSLFDVFVQPGSLLKPSARQEAAKGLISIVGANMALLAVLDQAHIPGVDVEWNVGKGLPTVRYGSHHFDPWAGYNTLAKLVVGIGKDVQRGVRTHNWDQMAADLGHEPVAFARKGLGPVPGKLADIGTGKDFLGQPYSLSKDLKSGGFARDLASPFIVDSIYDAYNADGLEGVAIDTLPSLLSAGVNTYASVPDARVDEARRQFGKPYDQLLPSQQKAVNDSEAVKSVAGKQAPSEYQQAKAATMDPIQARQDQAETAFQNGELSQPIQDIWHDLGKERKGARAGLEAAFTKTFSKFEKDQFDKALDGYYSQEVLNADGTTDFDATTAKQQDYLNALSPEQQTWLNDFLDTSAANQSPLRQEYLAYIDQREKAGYFDLDQKDPGYSQKLAALDLKNPEIDVANWYWKGGLKDGTGAPSLNSAAAVDLALQKYGDLPNRPIKLSGLQRPINQDAQSLAAWQAAQKPLLWYQNDLVTQYGDKQAAALYASTGDPGYNKPYAQLDDKHRSAVSSALKSAAQRSFPEIDAWLMWWGQSETLQSQEAANYFQQIVAKYGKKNPKAVH